MYLATSAFISSIGVDTNMTMAAIDAQITGYRTGDHRCRNGAEAIVAALEDGLFMDLVLDIDIDGHFTPKLVRCLKLLALTLDSLKQKLALPKPAPLLWLGSESEQEILSLETLPLETIVPLFRELDAPIKLDAVYPFNLGRAAGMYALEFAYKLMYEQGHDYVLLGSAESPFSADWLEALDQRQRLKAEGILDGFAPGEGAGFILLTKTPEHARACLTEPLPGNDYPYIHRPGAAQSPSHWGNNTPHKGEALHQAMAGALARIENPSEPCDAIVSSLNGELFWVKEHRIALARLNDVLKHAELYHPFEFTGDLGPFSGILLLAHAAHLIQSAGKQNIMVYASSDGPWRSATIIKHPKHAPNHAANGHIQGAHT